MGRRIFQVGAVSYLNAKPLLYGLDSDPAIALRLDVPARLLTGLESAAFDVALLPVIDYQRAPGLRIVPAGGIGSDGPTLTVRIFSHRPIEQITTLGCDPDSHTSVALARIVLAELYGTQPELVPLQESPQARLLIGDKVVAQPPMEYDLDLGEAWKRLTGMPFVFAVWTARSGIDLADLPTRLTAARLSGMANIEPIVESYAATHGWPPELARKYLTSHLKFEIGPGQLSAIEHFHKLAAHHALIPSPPKPLVGV